MPISYIYMLTISNTSPSRITMLRSTSWNMYMAKEVWMQVKEGAALHILAALAGWLTTHSLLLATHASEQPIFYSAPQAQWQWLDMMHLASWRWTAYWSCVVCSSPRHLFPLALSSRVHWCKQYIPHRDRIRSKHAIRVTGNRQVWVCPSTEEGCFIEHWLTFLLQWPSSVVSV